MADYKPGDNGRFLFILRKKGQKLPPVNVIATVIDTDGKYLLLRDNDDIEYLPRKTDIKRFFRAKPINNENQNNDSELVTSPCEQEVQKS